MNELENDLKLLGIEVIDTAARALNESQELRRIVRLLADRCQASEIALTYRSRLADSGGYVCQDCRKLRTFEVSGI